MTKNNQNKRQTASLVREAFKGKMQFICTDNLKCSTFLESTKPRQKRNALRKLGRQWLRIVENGDADDFFIAMDDVFNNDYIPAREINRWCTFNTKNNRWLNLIESGKYRIRPDCAHNKEYVLFKSQ